MVLPIDPGRAILVPGGPQTINPRNFAVPDGLIAYYGFDHDCVDFDSNSVIDLTMSTAGLGTGPFVCTTNASASNSAGYSIFSLDRKLPNGATITSVGFYYGSAFTMKFKIAQRHYAGAFTCFATQTYSHGGTGWEDVALATPFVVPATGDFYLGSYSVGAPSSCGNSVIGRAYVNADVAANAIFAATEQGSGAVPAIRFSTVAPIMNDAVLNNFTAATPGPFFVNGPGNGSNSAGYTVFSRDIPAPNCRTITSIGFYHTTSISTNVKLALRNSAGNMTAVVSEAFTHGGTGWEDHTLSSPYAVPTTGSYYFGVYSAAAFGDCGNSLVGRGYVNADATGTFSTTEEGAGQPVPSIRFTATPYGSLGVGQVGGGALTFDGVTSFVNLGGQGQYATDTQTIAFWLLNKGTNKTSYLFARNGYGDVAAQRSIYYVGGNMKFAAASYNTTVLAYTSINNGDFFAFVLNYPSVVVYQNGVPILSATSSQHFSGGPMYAEMIGKNGSLPYQYIFDGTMDEVRYYNRPLDHGEVMQIYQAGLRGRRDGSNAWLESQMLPIPPTFTPAWAVQNNQGIGMGFN